MTPFDRKVRARIYEMFVDGVRSIDARALARSGSWSEEEVAASLRDLQTEHRVALTDDGGVRMAHPFSGVPTPYRAEIGQGWWQANCAWDALAILSLLGDGVVLGPGALRWAVSGGEVQPNGMIHLVVPARSFWDDVGFT